MTRLFSAANALPYAPLPLNFVILKSRNVTIQRLSLKTVELHPLGNGSRRRVLSQCFRRYSWLFTDVLIDKLVALKVEQVEHARDLMVASTASETEDDTVRVRTMTSQDGEARAKRLSQEWAELKRDVMHEIAVCDSSKDLLSKVVESWLPEVLAADMRRDSGDSQDRIPELYL